MIICDDVLHWAETTPPIGAMALLSDPPYEMNFMSRKWDRSGIAFRPETWAALARHLIPGAFVMAFASSRGYHRLACAMEDAGLILHPSIFNYRTGEVLDVPSLLGWSFGSGFPKSTRIDTQVDSRGGETIGWFGEFLRGWRQKRGISQRELCERGEWFDEVNHGGAVSNWELGHNLPTVEQYNKLVEILDLPVKTLEAAKREIIGRQTKARKTDCGIALPAQGDTEYQTWDVTAPATPLAQAWAGHRYGLQCLKPSLEPVIVAQVPYSGKPVASIVQHGAGALWVEGGRVSCSGGSPSQQRRETARQTGNAPGRPGQYRETLEDRTTPETYCANHPGEAAGRWPANFCLQHVSIPVMRLKGHLPYGIIEPIRRYYDGYSGVSLLRTRKDCQAFQSQVGKEVLHEGVQEQIRDKGSHAETGRDGLPGMSGDIHHPKIMAQEWAQEVLQEGLSRSLPTEIHRPESSTIREETQKFFTGQNSDDASRARTQPERAESSDVEGGKAYIQWRICRGNDQHAQPNPATISSTDEAARELHSGASDSHGREVGQTAPDDRTCPSYQRHQKRQSPRESSDRGQSESFAGASQDRCGDGEATEGECSLEILARDIPPGWYDYFEPTGENLGCRPLGTRQVRGTNRSNNRSGTIFGGGATSVHTPDYASPDGTETVPTYACAENCPVRALDLQAGERSSGARSGVFNGLGYHGGAQGTIETPYEANTGNASRFFHTADWALEVAEQLAHADPVRYEAKASRSERDSGLDGMPLRPANTTGWSGDTMPERRDERPGRTQQNRPTVQRHNPHPTIKPISLCAWLARLLLPPAAYAPRRILVPFAGTGSEGIGALLAGWEEIVMVEQDAAYCAMAAKRLEWWRTHDQPSLWPGMTLEQKPPPAPAKTETTLPLFASL